MTATARASLVGTGRMPYVEVSSTTETVARGNLFELVEESSADRRETERILTRPAAAQRLVRQVAIRPPNIVTVLYRSGGVLDVSELDTVATSVYGVSSHAHQLRPLEAGSTALDFDRERLFDRVRRLFAMAEHLEFEDGMENDFSKALFAMVRREGSVAIRAFTRIMSRFRHREDLAVEVLLCLGRLDDPPTTWSRSMLLQRYLFSERPKVRDAAAVGLASLGDPLSVPSLEKAIAREELQELRQDMLLVLHDLKSD